MKTLLLTAAVILFSSPAFAQQRVIVEKSTGNVVDVGDSTLQYDPRYFDNLTYSAGIGKGVGSLFLEGK